MPSDHSDPRIRALLDSLEASKNRVYPVPRVTSLSFEGLCRALEVVEKGGNYGAEEIENCIWEMVYSPLFTDGTIVQFRFPEGTSDRVRERITQIHAKVCAGWGCDPSWSRDPKA